ncbi:MAG TPA: clostripain-related cysteine peptidase [Candidatus Eremiobacteraeota bacterium]|nr:MAG: Clostripain precursor [bacterium ADurb.Bin363]HPZ09792.1 clostripain-related cysteine peptidase [Candidatus Eremiobacteraeota bacterium]
MDNIRQLGLTPHLTSASPKVKREIASTPNDAVQLGSDNAVPEGVHKKWLFMNFIAADCNLKKYQEANIDNQELVGSDANTHIIAMIDVGPGANPLGGTWTGCRTFYVTQDNVPNKVNSPVVADHGNKVDMSDPATLTKFIVDSMAKFPSDYVALVLNDHGGGFTGALADDTDGGFMSTPQLRQALADAEKITGKKIDIIGYDACLMAEAEVAHELKDNANILLASEESELGPGWTYSGMLNKAPGMTEAIGRLQEALEQRISVSPVDFAKIVVAQNEVNQRYIPTFSATDLTKIDTLTKTVDEFAKAIIASEEKSAIKTAMTKGDKYGSGYTPYKYLRDLHNLADNVGNAVQDVAVKEAAKNVKKAFKEAIIANEHSYKYPNSEGLTIFAPTTSGSGVGYKYGDLAFAKETQWDEALVSIGKTPTGSTYLNEDMGEMYATPPEVPEFWPDGSPRKPQA